MSLLLLLALTVPESYRTCEVSVGKLASCGATYSGEVVQLDRQLYRSCQIAAGTLRSCAHPFTGPAVLLRDGKYRECDLKAGRVFTCKATGFTGAAVLRP